MRREMWVVESLYRGAWTPAGDDAAFGRREDALAARDRWRCGPDGTEYRVVRYTPPKARVKR